MSAAASVAGGWPLRRRQIGLVMRTELGRTFTVWRSLWLLARTKDAGAFHKLLNGVVLEERLELEAVAPADDDVNAVYQYLIGSEAESL